MFSEKYKTVDDWIKKEGEKLAEITIFHDNSSGFFIAVWIEPKTKKRYWNMGDTVAEAIEHLIYNSPLQKEAYPLSV